MLKKIIIALSVAIVSIFVLLGVISAQIYNSGKDILKDYYNSLGDENSSGWTYDTLKIKYSVIVTKFDILSPVYSLVEENGFDETKNHQVVHVFTTKRDNHFQLKVETQINVFVANKSFDEVVSIAQKYDLSKDNPDPANIAVAPKLEEIKGNQGVVPQIYNPPVVSAKESLQGKIINDANLDLNYVKKLEKWQMQGNAKSAADQIIKWKSPEFQSRLTDEEKVELDKKIIQQQEYVKKVNDIIIEKFGSN